MPPDRRHAVGLLLLANGCSRAYPLSEVPIEGGTEEVRAIVELELEFFQEAIEPHTVELSRIIIGDGEPAGELWGQYRSNTRRVLLDEAMPVEDVSVVVRHELCHALDYQAGLGDKSHEAIDAYAERLSNLPNSGLSRDDPPRQRRSEALARICEVGPTVAAAASVSCPSESPLLVELASFALTEIWLGVPPGPPPVPQEPPVSFAPPDAPFLAFELQPTEDPDLLQLEIAHLGEDPPPYTLDLQTGAQVEPEPEVAPADNAEEVVPPGPPLERTFLLEAVGWPDLAAMTVFLDIKAFPIDEPGGPRERMLWWDGERWSAVPLCLSGSWLDFEQDPPQWDLFTAQDQVWYAEGDGQQVWWSPVVGQDP
jgi:hypothetical protein